MKHKTLSEFEWQIMKIIWQKSKASVREVHDIILENQEKAYTTVQTYIERLVTKNLLQKEKVGAINFYTPKISEAEIRKNETRSLMKKVFDGSFSKMAAFLFDVDDVSEQDLEKIKSLLKENKDE
jgi:BlaI family penicillinase repressor